MVESKPVGTNIFKTYEYEELPTEASFRVVELLPGKTDDPVCCQLHVADWSNPPTYEAVSYTWGDATLKASVYCHGHQHEITANLYEALQYLRLTDRSRYLWADALCTNQSNVPERGNQVNQMRRIYHNAERVLIWLGPDSQDCMAKVALDLIHKFADHLCKTLGLGMSELRSTDDVYQKIILENRTKLPKPDQCDFIDSSAWKPLKWFYSHRYFTRAWVIQEINANENRLVHCGHHIIDWDRVDLVAAYFIMKTAWSQAFGFSDAFCWWVSTVSGEMKHHKKDWLHMLYLASNFSCADPRDIIYSLRGMIEVSAGHELLRPDYDNIVLDVYRNSVEAALINFENTDVLLYTTEENSPSWIPRWNQSMLFRNPFRFGKPMPWKPAGNSKPSWKIDRLANILSLKGFIVGTIEYTRPYNESYFGTAMAESIDGKMLLKTIWLRMLQTIARSCSHPPLERTTLQAAAASFSFGLNQDTNPEDEYVLLLNFVAYLRNVTDELTFETYIPSDLAREAVHADGNAFGKPVWDFQYPESTFFITDNNIIGCTTSRNQPGDLVFVARGSTYPLIFRPEENHYYVRGFSWVSGVMHGELQGHEDTVFTIH